MLIKIIGTVMIMVSACLFGVYWGSRESFRLRELLELKRALNILRGEISFSRSPLGDALSNIEKRTEAPTATIFGAIAKRLAEKNEPFNNIWTDEFKRSASRSHLSYEDIELAASLSSSLGQADAKTQERSLELMMEAIEKTTEELRETAAKNKKLFRSLGALAGILVSIVLL